MEFAPLRYTIQSITIWHFVILFWIAVPFLWSVGSAIATGTPLAAHLYDLIEVLGLLSALYFVVAPLVGQVYGDTYPRNAIEPSAFVVGAIFAAVLALLVFLHIQDPLASRAFSALIAFGVAAPFMSIVILFAWWAGPRMVNKPSRKRSWGVKWGVRL